MVGIRTTLTLLAVLSTLTACGPIRAPGDLPSRAAESRFLSAVHADVEEHRDPQDLGIGLRRRLTAHSAVSLAAQRGGREDLPTLGVALAVQYAF